MTTGAMPWVPHQPCKPREVHTSLVRHRHNPHVDYASHPISATVDIEVVQRRTVRTLVTSQVVGGLGVSGGVAVGALLATAVLGSEDLAGFAQSAQVLGAALLALPAARLSVARGR